MNTALRLTLIEGGAEPPPDVKERAKALTKAWEGAWNDATTRSRGSACPVCGGCYVSITATPKNGILLCCNACGAGKAKGDDGLIKAAAAIGIDCGPGIIASRLNPGPRPLPPASQEKIEGLKPAERRVLTFVARQAVYREWVEVSRRSIVSECRVSSRDATALLDRLAIRGLFRIRSNKYEIKHRTRISFLVNPADLSSRIGCAAMEPPSTPNALRQRRFRMRHKSAPVP